MAIIFNSKDCLITKEEMKLLYRKNLIECNDYTLEVAIIPDWAIEEAENLINKQFKGTNTNEDSLIPKNKIDMLLKNKYDYPGLFEYLTTNENGCK